MSRKNKNKIIRIQEVEDTAWAQRTTRKRESAKSISEKDRHEAVEDK